MKKYIFKRKKYLISILILIGIILSSRVSFASDIANKIKGVEYTEEFKQYLTLPEEEKSKVLQPRMFNIESGYTEITNPLKLTRLKGKLPARYSLKDVIGKNVIVKDQKQTNLCWGFASIASLETNLALNDYYNGREIQIYDFSERHMNYATTREFANGKINENGFNRKPNVGGNNVLAEVYLTNGYGAIQESDMPFENDESIIDISKIQNKKVVTTVKDTINFPIYSATSITTEEINEIKEHIKNNGGIFAGIHGASGAISLTNCYNNDTGALYCDNSVLHKSDHAVALIGWDDNYSVNNFNEDSRPKRNGAWIAKNSWGEKIEYTLDEVKQMIFEVAKEECIKLGWNDPSQISDEKIKEFLSAQGYTITGNKAVKKIGDNGIIYISYEDVNIYKSLWGIEKATSGVEYDNIYMYNNYGITSAVRMTTSKAYLANIFKKKTNKTEYLTEVSIYAPETYTCSVYVNPKGESMAKKDLQKVDLKSGESETIDSGYHTLEFLKPIEIQANNFAIIVEVQTKGYSTHIALESKVKNVAMYDPVEIENGKCFIATPSGFETNEWIDLSELSKQNSTLQNGDGTIRAFTTNTLNDGSLKSIEIATPPNKTSYFEGDNFDKTGMVVKANYNRKTAPSVILDSSNYNITNGTNLKAGQNSVTITYKDKSVEQSIKVEKNSVTSIKITTPPKKTEYLAGQSFDKTGMIVKAIYKDGTSKEIEDYVVTDGNNLKNGQTEVTITYANLTTKQVIKVNPNPVIKIEIKHAPNKTKYVVGQDFDTTGMVIEATYEDGTIKEITDYTIENGTKLEKTQESITISFDGQEVSQKIIVEEKAIVSIKVNKMPTKTEYIQRKEELDLTGGSIKAIYNDGTEEEIQMTSKLVTTKGFNNEDLGELTIEITYESKTTTFNVKIIKEITAENSNFSNAKTNIKSMKLYTFTDTTKREYILMDIEVSNIIKNTNNDNYEYYYYLSPNKQEEDIENWVKINEEQNLEDNLTFTINTSDVSNYGDIANSEKLYLYIKEVAKKGADQKIAQYGAFELGTTDSIETYLNGNLQQKESNGSKDNTSADKKIPYTGAKNMALIALGIIIVLGIVHINLRKYKDIK